MSWVLAAVDAYARSLRREFGDRFSTIGGSDIGQCLRKIFCSKNEGGPYEVPRNPGHADSWGATLRGVLIENHFAVPALRKAYGNRLRYAGAEQRTLESGFLSATPDGLLVDMPDDALAHLGTASIGGDNSLALEVKSNDPRISLAEPKPAHAYQTQIQLGLFHEVTPHRPEYGLVIYIDASFLDTIREFPIKRDPKIFAAAKARALKIMGAKRMEDLLPEGWIAGGQECESCPWAHACGHERGRMAMTAMTPPTQEFVNEAVRLAHQVKHLECTAALAVSAYRGRRHELVELLRAHGHRSITGSLSINWAGVKPRTTFEGEGIRKAATSAGLDLTPYEHTGAPSDRLTISAAPAARKRGSAKEEMEKRARLGK
jgi:hypothetical protein